jgi:sortase A
MSASTETHAEQAEAPAATPPARARLARPMRILGTVLVVAGVLTIGWTITVWQWQDPFTALYTLYQQHKLDSEYKRITATYRPSVPPATTPPATTPPRTKPKPSAAASLAAERRRIAAEAAAYRHSLRSGHALGRLTIPHLGLKAIIVTGTDSGSLTKGPGWYTGTYLPGEGKLMYIAGHRTTYLAPFAHIDRLRRGDEVEIEVPYGTFLYRVRSHVIVPSNDLDRLRSKGHEVIALQACHPRFFATHRYIVYAVPVRVIPRVGKPYPAG